MYPINEVENGSIIKTYSWLGSKLKGIVSDKTYIFDYNARGIRERKFIRNGSVPISDIYYFYDSRNRLVGESRYGYSSTGQKTKTSDIIYIYDATGLLYGFRYNGVEYYYDRDILGNINHIINSNGLIVATYKYEAYGKHKVLNASGVEVLDSAFIGNINPIRYKGYYYDVETQLFYCNSRYYSPELCRWISPDSIEYLDPQSINGLNLYCYCMNNPIMYSDESGHSPDSFWKTLLGVVVGVGLAVVTVAAVVASGGTLLVPVLVGAGVGAGLNLVGQGVSNLSQGKGFFEDINWGNVALGGLSGAAFATGVGGLLGAVAIGATSNAGMSALEGNSWANIGFSALVGGASAFAGFKLGKFVSNKLLNINTNLGVGDYVNMARVDGAGFLSRSAVALMSKLYTMGPTIVTGVGRGVTKFVGNYIGDWF